MDTYLQGLIWLRLQSASPWSSRSGLPHLALDAFGQTLGRSQVLITEDTGQIYYSLCWSQPLPCPEHSSMPRFVLGLRCPSKIIWGQAISLRVTLIYRVRYLGAWQGKKKCHLIELLSLVSQFLGNNKKLVHENYVT